MNSKTNLLRSNSATKGPPDFLIIGAQRSGTSWLNKNLGFHPEIWLTPIKELHHFTAHRKTDRRKIYRYVRHMRRRSFRIARQIVTFDNQLIQDLQWDAHYFLRRRTNEWYSVLFRPNAGQIAGEATPAYGTLSLGKIREVRTINPDMKMIYIMRDPIDRGWSVTIKDLAKIKKRMISDVPDEQIYEKLNYSGVTGRSNYLAALENWESVFGPEHFFVDYFENVVEKPKDLLLRIHRFLGITASEEFISPKVGEKINPAGKYKSAIPRRFQIHLAKQQMSHLRSLSKRFGGPTIDWLKRAERILADSKQ